MNVYDTRTLYLFNSPTNRLELKSRLLQEFADPSVRKYVIDRIDGFIDNFASRIDTYYLNSNLKNRQFRGEQNPSAQLSSLNRDFNISMHKLIHDTFYQDARETYTCWGDGRKTAADSFLTSQRRVLCDTDTRGLDDPAGQYRRESIIPGKKHGERGLVNLENYETPTLAATNGVQYTAVHGMSADQVEMRKDNDKLLDKWRYCYRPRILRDDPQGETASESFAANMRPLYSDNPGERTLQNSDRDMRYDTPRYYGQYDETRDCTVRARENLMSIQTNANGYSPDATDVNDYNFEGNDANSGHINRLLATPYILALNQKHDDSLAKKVVRSTYEAGNQKYRSVELTGEGMSANPQNDLKLFSPGENLIDETDPIEVEEYMKKRIFNTFNFNRRGCRAGSESADCQIPFYRRALHVRNYDRDVAETLGGFELDGLNGRTYDMRTMYSRLER